MTLVDDNQLKEVRRELLVDILLSSSVPVTAWYSARKISKDLSTVSLRAFLSL
jgi:hypothetical protein